MEAVGLRVVRGSDWIWGGQDGGEGYVGTVVRPCKSQNNTFVNGCTFILWDSGQLANYRVGHKNSYDLCVLDTSLIGSRHSNIKCNVCEKDSIIGIRWSCKDCSDYNLCSSCYSSDEHQLSHSFCRYDLPTSRGVLVPPRCKSVKVEAMGIYTAAIVVRGPGWRWNNQDGGEGNRGLVCEITEKEGTNAYQSWCRVTWDQAGTNDYRRGHEGALDLRCVIPSSGGYYYRGHLARLGKYLEEDCLEADSDGEPLTFDPGEIQVGDWVTIDLEPDIFKALQEGHGGWHDRMVDCVGRIGRVSSFVGFGDFLVEFPGLEKPCRINPIVLSKQNEFLPQHKEDSVRPSDMTSSLEPGLMLEDSFSDPISLVSAAANGLLSRTRDILSRHPGQVDVRNCGKTALQMACLGGHVDVVKALIDAGADVMAIDNDGDTPAHFAVIENQPQSLEILIEFGADVNALNKNLLSPLHVAVRKGSQRCVEVLLQRNCDTNLKDNLGDTALHDAVSCNNNEIVELLVNASNVDFYAKNERGFSVLQQATLVGNCGATECILKRVPDLINITKSDGMTPLHIAAINGHAKVAEALIDSGKVNLDAVNVIGQTPLQIAIFQNQLSVAEVLVLRGAGVNIPDGEGNTPLHFVLNSVKNESMKKVQTVEIPLKLTEAPFLTKLKEHLPIHLSHLHWLPVAVFLIKHRAENGPRERAPLDVIRDFPSIVEYLQKVFASVESSSCCIICSENSVQVTCESCGHRIVCEECGKTLKKCFQCGSPIKPTDQNLFAHESSIYCPKCKANVRNVTFLCGHGCCSVCLESMKHCLICGESTETRIVLF